MGTETDELDDYLDRDVVVDTASSTVYVGRLVKWGAHFVELLGVDVHDLAAGTSTKDGYVLAALKHGIQKNRRRVLIRKDVILSLSRLDEVINF